MSKNHSKVKHYGQSSLTESGTREKIKQVVRYQIKWYSEWGFDLIAKNQKAEKNMAKN